MSKIKEHYHDEICAEAYVQNKQYAVDAMKSVTKATHEMQAGKISPSDWYRIVQGVVVDFENMHDECPPK